MKQQTKTEIATTRRSFLQTMAGATALAMTPLASLQAQPGQRLLLGLDTYSIRGLKWKAPQVLDHAASLKLDDVMMSVPCFESFE
jgi:hypothetical protein